MYQESCLELYLCEITRCVPTLSEYNLKVSRWPFTKLKITWQGRCYQYHWRDKILYLFWAERDDSQRTSSLTGSLPVNSLPRALWPSQRDLESMCRSESQDLLGHFTSWDQPISACKGDLIPCSCWLPTTFPQLLSTFLRFVQSLSSFILSFFS